MRMCASGQGTQRDDIALIDFLAIGVTHLLLVLAALRLLSRGDLDREADPAPLSPVQPTQAPPLAAPSGRVGVARLPRPGERRA